MRSKQIITNLLVLFFYSLSVIPGFADLQFRDHRFNAFRALPPSEKGDIVFIGNSITNMMNWDELFGISNIKNRGVSGAYTKEILENLESMVSGQPSKIFVMIGTNDLGTEGFEYQPEAVAYRIQKILKRIREEVPEAEVYYQSILPSLVGLRSKEKTLKTNGMVQDWIISQNDPSLQYIDIYTPLADSDGGLNMCDDIESSFSFDGLHLTQKGYKIWADIICEYVGAKPVITENAVNLSGGLKKSAGMRASYFGALPIASEDILLIGDEMIHGGEWNELTGSLNFKDRGFGWWFRSMTIDAVNSILTPIFKGNVGNGIPKENPKGICLYVGFTDIESGKPVDTVISNYQQMLSGLRSLQPETPLFLMTLLPVNSNDSLDRNIVEFNDGLKNLASESEKIFLIDTYNVSLDKDGRRIEKYFTDTSYPYLSGLGYVAVADEVVNVLNSKLSSDYSVLSIDEAIKNINSFEKNTEKRTGAFTVFDNKNSSVPYRIPAIATTPKGNLIALSDYRYSKADIGMVKNGRLDIKYRIKDYDSGEWGEEKTLIAAFGEGDSNIAFGDPCIVADRESDMVLVTSCCGNVSYPKGTHENHQGWARIYSEDGGETWSEYEDIADQVFQILDQRNDGPINAFFIGSGKITQSQRVKTGDYYRLYCSALVKVNDRKTNVNYVFYSDDFGKTWNLLGDVNDCPIPYGADEPKTEELPDGSVLVSSRIKGGRFFNIFHFSDIEKAEGKWGEMAKSNVDVKGLIASDNACNGEVLCIPVINTSNDSESFLLLQSVPLDPDGKRAKVGINYKELQDISDYSSPENLARDWDGIFEVSPYSSAYSTMVLDKDNAISFLYEENVSDGGYDIIYKQISIEDLTNGKYVYNPQNQTILK